ncbi:MAG: PspC domain-containing protein [Oscillospiraceae bacterium]
MDKKLYKSRNQKMVCGICGGVAEYFNIDTTLVRLIWAAFCICGGAGIIAYILAAIIIPEPPYGE